jgi:hypothetical protein
MGGDVMSVDRAQSVTIGLKGWMGREGLWNWTSSVHMNEVPTAMPLTPREKEEYARRAEELLNTARYIIMERTRIWRMEDEANARRGHP